MAKQVKVLSYRELTYATFKEKSSVFFLGLATFSAIVLTGFYIYAYAVKNTFTPQQVAKKETKGVTAPKFPTTYTVIEGDTLASISQKMYGSDAYADQLAAANNFPTPENLEVGTKVTVPAVTPIITEGQIGEGLMTAEVTYKGDTYIVQPGDTLSIIALKVYGDINAWVKLAEVNGLSNPEVIEEGTVLKIPAY